MDNRQQGITFLSMGLVGLLFGALGTYLTVIQPSIFSVLLIVCGIVLIVVGILGLSRLKDKR